MMKFKFLCLLIVFGHLYWAQNHFELKEVSENYSAAIDMATCNERECSGKGVIHLTDKKTSERLPPLISDDLIFSIETDSASTKSIKFSKNQNPFIFGDFNFDGYEDLALVNYSLKPFDTFLYDVYVFDPIGKKFVADEGLTHLVKNNSAMFTADSMRKRLIIKSKSGCCLRFTKEYTVFPGRDPLKVYEFEEDTADPETVITKKNEFIDYKWFTKITKYPKEVYYKDKNDENTEGN